MTTGMYRFLRPVGIPAELASVEVEVLAESQTQEGALLTRPVGTSRLVTVPREWLLSPESVAAVEPPSGWTVASHPMWSER